METVHCAAGSVSLHFWGCVETLLKWQGTHATEKSRVHVARVLGLFAKAQAGQYLRRTRLVLAGLLPCLSPVTRGWPAYVRFERGDLSA